MKKQEQDIHLLDYWRIIMVRRQIALSFFAVVVAVTAVYSFLATPHYQSTAKLLVNQEANTTMTFGESGSPQFQFRDPAEYAATLKKVLYSRAFADHVVRKYSLDKSAYFAVKKEKSSGGVFSAIRSFIGRLFPAKKASAEDAVRTSPAQELDPWITSFLLSGMSADFGRSGSILEIRFDSDNPGISAQLANALAVDFIAYNLELRVNPYRNSVAWLTERLNEMKAKMESSEQDIQKYKEQKGVVSYEARENIISQKLQGQIAEQVRVQSERQEAEIKYKQIKDVLNKPQLLTTVPDVMNNPVIQGLRTDELQLKKEVSELMEKFGPKHPQMIKARSELEMVQNTLNAEARKMMNAAKTQYEIALSKERLLEKSIEETKDEVLSLSRELIDFKVVAGEAENNRRFYEMLLKKLQEATLTGGVTVSNMQVLDSAVVPSQPVRPARTKNMMLAVLVGLFGGLLLAVFLDYVDDSVKTPEDVDARLGQHYLGMVPNEALHNLVLRPATQVVEAFRTIRMGLLFASSRKPLKTLLVTSSVEGEGKTTTAINIAAALARTGEKVLLLDGDLRRRSLHKRFNMDNPAGIGSVIIEQADLASVIHPVEAVENMHILTAGPAVPNPAELLSSDRMKEILASLSGRFDRVIIDSPPVLPISDPLVLAQLCDGVIMVVRGGVTSRVLAKKACQALEKLNATIVGCILNNVKISDRAYGYYYSYYSYGYDEKG
jgi:capsular exopolysaccharide synthesis family protein